MAASTMTERHPMQVFDVHATRRALPFDALIAAIERVMASPCVVPPRMTLHIPSSQGAGMTTLVMPAWQADGYFGIKTVHIAPDNALREQPSLSASYQLFDARNGALLALIDGNELTARRTAAVSALAASRLVSATPHRQLVVGAGRVAEVLPEAYAAVLPLDRVDVWARRPEQAQAVVARLRLRGVSAHLARDLAEAARASSVVSCATLAREPLIRAAWLRPDSHLDLIGGFTPEMREADSACFAGAAVYVDSLEALEKSGDLRVPLAEGVLSTDDVRGDLGTVCALPTGAASPAAGRTVFKSVGTAAADLAAAVLVYESRR
jgi:ornithine cyclodeaminase